MQLSVCSVTLLALLTTGCGQKAIAHAEFTVGMNRSEILSRFGEPQRKQSLAKSGEPIWGAIEDFWQQVPLNATVEIWAYDTVMTVTAGESQFDQRGQTELYFIDASPTVDGIGFHVEGTVYESN